MSFTLSRTRQCKKCPWRVSTNPHDIPDGYCELKHKNLKSTIATPGEIRFDKKLDVMACHESEPGKPDYCVGWLHNQLGVGNNIGLRLQMMRCDNVGDIKVFAKQHQRFEDTLPK
jgi:hypothetical protein